MYVEPVLISLSVSLNRLLLLRKGETWKKRGRRGVREVLRHKEGLEDDEVDEDQSGNGEENLQHVVAPTHIRIILVFPY